MALAEDVYGFTDLIEGDPQNRYKDDDKLLVRFYVEPLENKNKSKAEGRPIYEDTEFVSIAVPGNRSSVIERPARDVDKQRFAKHYQMFKARIQDQEVEGTPLEEWPAVRRSQVEELKFFNVRTVEQLAQLSDVHAQNFRGIQPLKARANAFLEATETSAAAEKIASQDAEIAALKEQMAQLIANQPKPRKKPGPKPKTG